MAATRTMSLGRIGGLAICAVDIEEVAPLDPADRSVDPIIVEMGASGEVLDIVDGFHRAAGMVRWCREHGKETATCDVLVVACDQDDDEDLVSTASQPGGDQDEAIESLYRLAGVR